MHRVLHIMAALLCLCQPAAAGSADNDLQYLRTGAEARGWEAVGRLEVAGRAFCTGALIAADLVLTAAHCMFDAETGRKVQAGELRFRAGFRGGFATAERQASAYVIHPSFRYDGTDDSDRIADDLALVRLNAPVAGLGIEPFATAERPRKGAAVGVVSYGGSRAQTPALQEGCHVLARRRGMLMLDCLVEHGSSGAPVFTFGADGRAEIVSVISSMADVQGRSVALGTDLGEPLVLLRDLIADVGPARIAQSGPAIRRLTTTSGSGARFERP